MPPEMKRFDGRLAVPIGKIIGKVPEMQPVRMVTPNVLWDRPRARIKLQYKVQCTIFYLHHNQLEISSGSGWFLQNLFGAMCQSLDVVIPSWNLLRGIISHRRDAGVLIRFKVSCLVEANIHT